jgi:DNA repair protein RadC
MEKPMQRAEKKRNTVISVHERRRPATKADAPQTREDRVVYRAMQILEKRMVVREVLNDPVVVRRYLRAWLARKEVEHFGCLFLDAQHRLIAVETLARGTLDAASVYPREVVRAALRQNAAAVIFAHNHPSGVAEPSAADRLLTDRLRQALSLVDVRVLDHFVVGDREPISFAERGWL